MQPGVIKVRIPNVSVPALGYRVIYLIPASNKVEPLVTLSDSRTGEYVLDNDKLSVSIDK